MLKNIKSSLALTNKKEKIFLSVLYVLNVLSASLEAIGVGLVYIFFKVILESDNFGGVEKLKELYIWLDLNNTDLFFAFFTVFVMIVFLLRITMQLLTAWLGLWFRKKMHVRVAFVLFSGYMEIPYSRILNFKSSVLMNNLTTNVSAAVSQSTLGIIEIAGSITLTIFLISTLLIVKPIETLIAIVAISFFGFLYWQLIHEKLSVWGERMMIATEQVYAAVAETVQAIKTIKVTGVESKFEERFSLLVSEQQQMMLNNGLVQHLPRLILEAAIVCAIFGMMLIIFISGSNAKEAIPTLALFGFTSLRMAPAFIRIISALQLYKNTIPFIQSILPDYLEYTKNKLSNFKTNRRQVVKLSESIEFENISYKYEGTEKYALDKININIKKGQLIGFAGHSGSGKSTSVDILLGLLMPSEGRVLIDQKERTLENKSDSFGLFAYVPQEPVVLDGTVRSNVAFGIDEDEIDEEKVFMALRDAALIDKIESMPNGIDTMLGERGNTFSGGEKQRLGIARALYQDASVIIFDEPTAALDASTEYEITEAIRGLKQKKTVIVIAHRLSSIVNCDNIFFFDNGTILGEGSFSEIKNKIPKFEKMVEHLGMNNNK